MVPGSAKRGLSFLYLSVLLSAIGGGISLPVLPSLIVKLSGGSWSDAALISGRLVASFAVLQFLATPVLGRLSDAYGRRPLLLLSLTALGLECLIMASANTIAWLFFARSTSGIFCATGAVAAAYIADITVADQRAKRFGLLMATAGLGLFVGPSLGGILGEINLQLPFYVAAILALLSAFIGFFILPESSEQQYRRPMNWSDWNPLGALKRAHKHPSLFGLLLVAFLFQTAFLTSISVWPFFTTEKFGWGPGEIGVSQALVGLGIVLVQGIFLAKVVAFLGERGSILAGFSLVSFTFISLSLANAEWMLFALIIPYVFGCITMTALSAMVSKLALPSMQGETQGLIASVSSFAAIGTPLIMTQIFWYFTADTTAYYFPGAPYLAGGLLALVGLAVFCLAFRSVAINSHVKEGA